MHAREVFLCEFAEHVYPFVVVSLFGVYAMYFKMLAILVDWPQKASDDKELCLHAYTLACVINSSTTPAATDTEQRSSLASITVLANLQEVLQHNATQAWRILPRSRK